MDKLRLIQCGVGGFGGPWLKQHASQSPDFDLVAIVDVSPAALKDAGDAVGLPVERRFATLEIALDKTPAEAIVTVTPPAVHVQHARLAFARGLHVMTEKPIADTMENAREMVRLAKEFKRQLLVSQNYRFRPAIQQLKRLLAEKTAGEFGHGHIDFYIPADFTGSFRETMKYPLLVDMAIHHLDMVRCITGRNITRVTAQTFNPAWSWYQHHAGLKMLMELDNPGGPPLPLSYSGDWSAHGRNTSWNGNWRLQCASGSLHLDLDQITLVRNERWGKNPTSEVIEPTPLPRHEQVQTLHDFAQAIRTAAPAETSGQDNIWSFAAVMAAVRSAEERRSVNVAELVSG